MYYPDTRRAEERQNAEVEFSHFVVVSNEGAIICFTRNNGSVYKLHMDTGTGWIKIQSTDQWFSLPDRETRQIRQKAQESFGDGKIRIYRVPRFIL